ncbi:MAG: hypothetical protein ACYDBY_08920 [Thermoanaerobaculia bacterium]
MKTRDTRPETPESTHRELEVEPAVAACCSPAEKETCCAPSQKASCCTPDASSCGCA